MLKNNLDVLEFEYKRVLERNEKLEEDIRRKDALEARILSLEEDLKTQETENSNLINDLCRAADDIVKLTEKCKNLEDAASKAEAARSLSIATGNPTIPSTIDGQLPSWPFELIRDMLRATPVESGEGTILRQLALNNGAIRCVLSCLATYAHHEKTCPTNSTNTNPTASSSSSKVVSKKPKAKSANKSNPVWAKGTGYASGSTSGKWDVNQMLNKRRFEEENVTMLLEILAYFVSSDTKLRDQPATILEEMDDLNAGFAPADQLPLPAEFLELVDNSCLLPVLSSYLRNDSVLDIVGRIPLYQSILMLLRVITFHHQMVKLLFPKSPDDRSIVDLLRGMERGIDAYWSTLTKNEVIASSSSADKELSEFVCNVSTTSTIVEIMVAKNNPQAPAKNEAPASIEEIYLRTMEKLQYGFWDMISESADNKGYKFNVTYHFEQIARADEKKNTPARIKRLALETSSLRTTLPLSYSSSVFVRRDTDRLDVMKVMIVGPAETPYSNGCFVFDVYFPANYPNGPMLVNLETTGRGTIRFNPNLYPDGKVCLSILNTWSGSPEERWNAKTSSLLQVLVSIQSLILVPDPYFNEPGYQTSRNTAFGQQESRNYNSRIIQATVQWAMLEQLRNPSPCFKEIIQTHFFIKRNEVVEEIEKWIEINAIANTDTSALKTNLQHLIRELKNLPRPDGVEEDERLQFVVPPEPN